MKKRPVIGVTTSQEKGDHPALYTAGKLYSLAVEKAGGIPVILPVLEDRDVLKATSEALDGLLLSGGIDVDPLLFNEEPVPKSGRIDPQRDQYEYAYIEFFHEAKKPMFGICRGCQVMNLAFGGTIYQDITSQREASHLKHAQDAPRWHPTHSISIKENTRLAQIYPSGSAKVNSFHHQSVKEAAPGFMISAEAPDGIVEAIESKGDVFMIGLQWHPEHLWMNFQDTMDLFTLFIQSCV